MLDFSIFETDEELFDAYKLLIGMGGTQVIHTPFGKAMREEVWKRLDARK